MESSPCVDSGTSLKTDSMTTTPKPAPQVKSNSQPSKANADGKSKENVSICLESDDDDIIEIRKVQTNCINDDCVSGENMQPASGFALSYYHVQNKRSNQLICEECRTECYKHYQILLNKITSNQTLFDTKFIPGKNYVELDDSDEEEVKAMPVPTKDEDKNLKDYLNSFFETCNIDDQIKKCVKYTEEKCEKNLKNLTAELKKVDLLQDRADKFRSAIYANLYKIKEVEPIEFDQFGNMIKKPPIDDDVVFIGARLSPPKIGEAVRPPIKEQETYYCEKLTTYSEWTRCKVVAISKPINDSKGDVQYRVAFIDQVNWKYSRLVTGKSLAYAEPPETRLQIGQRVIAIFSQKTFYAGIVAEPLSAANKFRYLIFFDDGYVKYVDHNETRLIAQVSANVWEDVPIQSRNYIESYLKRYPDRPMMKAHPGTEIRTEFNGKWWSAKIKKTDCSLVLMHFEDLKRLEWIYRGSHRLGPLYHTARTKVIKPADKLSDAQLPPPRRQFQNDVYVEYFRKNDTQQKNDDSAPVQVRAVARKSTTHTGKRISRPIVDSSSTSSFGTNKSQLSQSIVPFLPLNNLTSVRSRITYYTPNNEIRRYFRTHVCSPTCITSTPPLSSLTAYNMLGKPVMAGWHRVHLRYPRRREVRYVTPCNRSLRNLDEVHKYLTLTKSEFTIDLFDFDANIEVLAEYNEESPQNFVDDLSRGVETIPVPCVNLFEDKSPDYLRYTNQREPQDGVFLNMDTEFLCGCDCTDDCQDKKKCACWQLTIEGTKFGRNKAPDYNVGYYYKRLLDPVVTGIYECNSRCKCKQSCLNRVVQFPLKLKLQIFKTERRGWGLRTLSDVPRGTFICSYAGELLTEAAANEGGKNFGDEYLAELDYIEVVERWKEGYESDVPSDAKEESDEAENDSADDDYSDRDEQMSPTDDAYDTYETDRDFVCNNIPAIDTTSTIRTRLRTKKSNPESSESGSDKKKLKDDKNEKESSEAFDDPNNKPLNHFEPEVDDDNDEWVPKYKSVRKMFGENERIYVMDAKYAGNVGRFLNHSCTPNVFVQNVFVETHDLRFPMVSFFTLCTVKAGSELTWNYNYDVGSVPDKELYCFCGSSECRGRLL